jgi:hypothetical protein
MKAWRMSGERYRYGDVARPVSFWEKSCKYIQENMLQVTAPHYRPMTVFNRHLMCTQFKTL